MFRLYLVHSHHLNCAVFSVDEVALAATKSDKKMQGNQIRFILLKSLGEAVVDKTVTMDGDVKAPAHVSGCVR